jgi:hypothetical protein
MSDLMMTQLDRLIEREQFFYEHAGWSYHPLTETPERGRMRGARSLAWAEFIAEESGVTFEWGVDADIDSSDFSDETPAWLLWECVAYDADNEVIASLHGIDFGRDGEPDGEPYAKVVEAELASEGMN